MTVSTANYSIKIDQSDLDDINTIFAKIMRDGELPRWPARQMQKQYTSISGMALLKKTYLFMKILQSEGTFDDEYWKGLDYGCGWGRIASVIQTKGTPDQLDLCDAWPTMFKHLREAGFRNHLFQVSEVLRDSEIPEGTYSFIYAYSIFTHLSRPAFEKNLRTLAAALKPRGKLFFTVRHPDALPKGLAEIVHRDSLSEEGFWFTPMPGREVYGRTVVTPEYMRDLSVPGDLRYIGPADVFQQLYVIRR